MTDSPQANRPRSAETARAQEIRARWIDEDDRKLDWSLHGSAERGEQAVKDIVFILDQLRAAQDKIAYLVDLPLCRRQLPDGTVPENTEEALTAWHAVAMDALQQVRVLGPGGTYAWKERAEKAEARITELESALQARASSGATTEETIEINEDGLVVAGHARADQLLGGHIDPDCEVVRGVGWMCTCQTPEEKAEDATWKAECEAERDAETATVVAESERIRVLERAVGNCFMMAKRQIAAHLNSKSTPAQDLERWQHVQRFCETTGSKSSILRGQLPTELTEGAPPVATTGPDSAEPTSSASPARPPAASR